MSTGSHRPYACQPANRNAPARGTSTLPSRARQFCAFGLVAVCLFLSGCRAITLGKADKDKPAGDALSSLSIRGPLERILSNGPNDPLSRGRRYSDAARAALSEARQLEDSGKLKEATDRYKAISKEYKPSAAAEEALFRIAEIEFRSQRYPRALNAYEQLFEDYPSTRFVAPATEHLFTTARYWLKMTDPVPRTPRGDIKTVSATNEPPEMTVPRQSMDLSLSWRIVPNLRDRTRPTFDTQGTALRALKTIWLNDPTGPLADDALMLTATYHLRRSNFVEADYYFKTLREDYPQSPHNEDAYVLGSHVKLMSYQGPQYEGETLREARVLKERTLRLYPDSADRQRLRAELDELYERTALREWERVRFYQRKSNPRAAAIQAVSLLRKYPDSRYAQNARQLLRSTSKKDLRNIPGLEMVMSRESPAPAAAPDETSPSPEYNNPIRRVSAGSEFSNPPEFQ